MQTPEEKKARMRAYYRANRHKWKKYNSDRLARMSDSERAAFEAKQREYGRTHYKANRNAVIKRTSQYNQDHKEQMTLYRAEYFQTNKKTITARQRQRYHEVVKPRMQREKALSIFVSVSQAAEILGAKLRTFREWVYQGRIAATRTPGGRYLLRRADVEEILSKIDHIPEKIRKTLGLRKEGIES